MICSVTVKLNDWTSALSCTRALVPTLCVGTYGLLLVIDPMHSHAERGNENAPCGNEKPVCSCAHHRMLGLTATLFVACILAVHVLEAQCQRFPMWVLPITAAGMSLVCTRSHALRGNEEAPQGTRMLRRPASGVDSRAA